MGGGLDELSTEGDQAVHVVEGAVISVVTAALGFDLLPGTHPIVPIMLYDARIATEFSARLLDKGVYVTGFSFPVVPRGKARIRTQVSARHTKEDLDAATDAFSEVKLEMGI